ncbi:MAG: hypothetical protein RR902_00740 [Oscillospiraceae bacterium]
MELEITIPECVETFRANRIKMSIETLQAGIQSGAFASFAICIPPTVGKTTLYKYKISRLGFARTLKDFWGAKIMPEGVDDE